MNLFELFVKIGVDDQASRQVSDISSKLGNGLKTAAKVGTAAVTAAATGITALTTAAINSYAEYEQLVGGVETLFKDSANTVQKYANMAYMTAGMSANKYMETVTSFSASLLQSLGGDTGKAAEYANQALIDMSDNANKMGTSMEMIQNAYQGFAKQNYTMLDNLKLGYGGTKTEMERLIKDASKLDKSIKANDMSFANIVKAINAVQTEMGITGTTSKEAASTISGSVNMMKASWENFLVSLADSDADYQFYVDNLMESAKTVISNVAPVAEQVFWSLTNMAEEVLPEIASKIPEVISEVVPRMIEISVKLIESLVNGISSNQSMLSKSAISVVTYLIKSITSLLPEIIKIGLDLVVSIGTGIVENLELFLGVAVEIIGSIAEYILKPSTLTGLLDAALGVVDAIVKFVSENLEPMLEAATNIIISLVSYLLTPRNIGKITSTAVEIVVKLAGAIVGAAGELVKAAAKLVSSLFSTFVEANWGQLGRDVVAGFKRGISNAWRNLKTWFKGLFGDLIGIAKRILGIASPSKVFKKFGAFTAEGFGIGFEDEFEKVKKLVDEDMSFEPPEIKSARYSDQRTGGSCGFGFGNISIVVNGARYSDENELAEAIAEKIQSMAERRAAAYA